MSKEKNKLIPELRFPEFVNEGEWEVKELRDFCSNISSGKDNNSEVGKFKLYGSTGIIGRTESASYNGDYILIARVGANAGLLNRAKGEFGVTDNTLVLDLKKVDSIDFVHYSLDKIGLNKLVFGSGQPLITGGQLKSLQLISPTVKKEQQKIASCLSSLDEVIAAHSQKLDLLKEHKKGLMQNLFPKEGEKVPKLRFKEFVNDGEWVEIAIESVGNVVTGGTPSKAENEYWGGDFVWVTAQDFKEKYIYDSVLKLTNKGKNKSRVIPKNSVLVTCIASIGLNGINKVECATNQQINSIVCNSSNHYEFVYYAISKNITRLKNMAGQTAVPIISKSIFEKFTIQKPKNLKEQQKIASCLSSIDAIIAAQAEKVEQLKLHKKGLMQRLFPKIKD